MNRATLAWGAFKNMLRTAAHDPVWAFASLITLPFRIWQTVLRVLFILIVALFVVGMGGRFALNDLGYGPGTIPFIALDLVTLLVLAAIVFRVITNPLIIHFGNMEGETHGSARFATDKEMAPLARADTGLLIGRDAKTGKLLRYDGPAHLLTMAPTRTGKGVGTIIPNLLTADRSVICSAAQRHTHFLDSPRMVAVLGRSDFRFADLKRRNVSVFLVLPPDRLSTYSRWLRLLVAQSLTDMARDPAKPAVPVLYLLDEFAALGHLAPVERAMGLMAGYGVQLWPILQDVHQLRATYGQRAGTFLSNAGVLQVFGVNDHDSARLVSDLLGQETVVFQTMSRALDSDKSGISYGEQHTARPLLTPDEVRNLPQNLELLFLAGQRPVVAGELAYYADAEFRGLYDAP